MGRIRSTLILLVVAVGLGGYLYFVESKRPVEDAAAKKKLFTWEKVWGLPDQHFAKKWVKRVKECDLENYEFPTRVLS